MKKTKEYKTVLAVIIIIMLITIVIPLSIVVAFFICGRRSENNCIDDQIDRLAEISLNYENGSAIKIDEQLYCDFDLNDISAIKFNELRTVGTHNSYKKYQSFLNEKLVSVISEFSDIVSDGEMAYQHESPTEQLNRGYRNFEWDITRYNNKFDGFIIQHENFIDVNTWVPNFELGLQEVKMWSDYNSTHMPITIIFEIKHHTLPDNKKETINSSHYALLNSIATEVLGDSLITPSDMLNGYGSIEEMRTQNDYPTLDELQGKILLVIKDADVSSSYNEMFDEKEQIYFTADQANSIFSSQDDTPSLNTQVLVDSGYVTRIRADGINSIDQKRYADSIKYNAQLISSDYVKSEFNLSEHTFFISESNHEVTMALVS